jgi:hypothetical protein
VVPVVEGHEPPKLTGYLSGWTIFDKLYLLNGTLYLVSDEPSKIPARSLMISTGIPIENGPIEQAKQVPTDREMQIISRRDAKALFGLDAELIEGVSVSCPSFFFLGATLS